MPVEIINTVTPILLNLALGVITLLGALGTYYLQKGVQKVKVETAKIQDEATRNTIQTALDRLDDVAKKTVNKIEQTTKKDILAAIAQGTVSPDNIKYLAFDAYNEIIKTLEPDYLQAINETMGDSQTYIMNLIEEKLQDLKNGGQSLPSNNPAEANSGTSDNVVGAADSGASNSNLAAANSGTTDTKKEESPGTDTPQVSS